jgi:two-component system, sensor histidine kinase LadS
MLSSTSYLERLHKDLAIYWIYFSFMIVMAIYSLCIFILVRDLDYLYFTFFVFIYALFEFNFKGFASWLLWPDSTWWTSHANPIFICLITIFINLFLYEFTGFKYRFKKIYKPLISSLVFFPLLVAILSLFINIQLSLMLTFVLSLSILIVIIIFGIYMAFFQKPPSRQARIVIIAFSIYVITTPIVIFTMIGVLPVNFFTRWVSQLGSFIFIVLLSIGIADKINFMKNIIQKAEQKYRHLVESTSDIIFTLDDNNNILSINSAVRPHLGFKAEELVNTNFLELIQESSDKNYNITRQSVLENIIELKNKKEGTVRFILAMKVKYIYEPKEMKVNLEYAGYKDTEYAIMGKASPVAIDTHSEFLESERYTYNLNNYLTNAELLSQRLVRNLHKFADASAISDIKIAVCETIINSIEHGNLNLSFREKTEALAAGKYFDLIRERQMDRVFSKRKINIEYSLNQERVAYKISDEGDGFNYKWIFDSDPLNPDDIARAHGRGLMMVKNTFDVVKFNQKGNQILLVKYFNNSGPPKTNT